MKARRRRESSAANEQPEPSSPRASTRNPVSLTRRLSRGSSSLRVSSLFSAASARAKNQSNTTNSNNAMLLSKVKPAKSDLDPVNDKDAKVDAPRAFPKKPGVTHPLLTVDELLQWRPTGLAAKCVSRVPLSDATVKRYVRGQAMSARPSANPALNAPATSASRGAVGSLKRLQPPRLLLCHDFRGGYPQWEANADGVVANDCPKDTDVWRFNHWAYVDIFVYFSHYCVTIPPVGYVQAAHRHGSLVLGTLIFEWEAGAKELHKILASFKTRAKAASKLASIAKFYGFDGWLVNVEVELPGGSTAASDLAAFVGDLTRATRKIVGQVSEVVWYDAVTRDGSLKWQNELNQENEQFFKAAGSIFTNYHWDRNAPVRSGVKAGTRRTDVFTGIDIHGRNTFGGGGFQTHLALRAIKQGGTSAAVFAPAWTVEKCPPNIEDPRELEERFWTGPTARFGRDCVAQYFKERAVVTDLPFSTTFDPGWGLRQMKNGVLKDDNRYFNMAQQQVQPSFMRTYAAAGDSSAAELSLSQEEAFNGSASIKTKFAFSESRMLSGSFSILRLLVANVTFPTRFSSRFTKSQEGAVQVTYDYLAKSSADPAVAGDDFGLVLLLATPPVAVFLVGENSKWNTAKSDGGHRTTPRIQVLGKFVNYEVCVAASERKALGAPAGDDGSTGWMTRKFVLEASLSSGQRLVEVMVIAGSPPQQPVSVRPSPFMSQAPSRGASRIASRQSSRYGSRMGSAAVSRSNSPPRGERDDPGDGERYSRRDVSGGELTGLGAEGGLRETDARGGDLFGGSLLQQYRESFGQRRGGGSLRPDGNSRNFNEGMLRMQSASTGLHQHIDRSEEQTGSMLKQSHRSRLGNMSRGLDRGDGTRGGSIRQSSYAQNFQIGGTLDFDNMHHEGYGMYSESTSRALSRLSSRLQTPTGSRPLSQLGSRNGSLAASLVASRNASRVGSLQGSRLTSPTGTPQAGGGGALAIRDASRREMIGNRNSMQLQLLNNTRPRMDSGLNSGVVTPSRSNTVLSDLKLALMTKAGEMAGEVAVGNATASSGSCVVYLGGVSISVLTEKDSALPAISSSKRRQTVELEN